MHFAVWLLARAEQLGASVPNLKTLASKAPDHYLSECYPPFVQQTCLHKY